MAYSTYFIGTTSVPPYISYTSWITLTCYMTLLLPVSVRAFFTLTLLEPQSRFGDNSLKFQVVCPQNGTGVLKGLKRDFYPKPVDTQHNQCPCRFFNQSQIHTRFVVAKLHHRDSTWLCSNNRVDTEISVHLCWIRQGRHTSYTKERKRRTKRRDRSKKWEKERKKERKRERGKGGVPLLRGHGN